MVAIIDIGSNSVRLMLWADGKILEKKVNTTRLGEDLLRTSLLSCEAIERTAQAVSDFFREGRERGAEVCAFATAAVRSSSNGAEFVRRVKELTGLSVDVVSGEREAQLGLLGALGKEDGGVIDIGGASTEVVFRKEGEILFSKSFPLGALTLSQICGEDRGALDSAIEREILFPKEIMIPGKVYAIGGTASTLASLLLKLETYDAARIQDFPLFLGETAALTQKLFSSSVEERKKLPGMDLRRADTIACGGYLLEKIMKKLSLREVFFSDRDNLEGYLCERGLS